MIYNLCNYVNCITFVEILFLTMSKLFDYSKIAEGEAFAGRTDEVKRLSTDFMFLTNTVVLAPQGYGKSSLVNKAARETLRREKNFRFFHVDLFNVRNERNFYELLVQKALVSVSGSREEVLENVVKYCPRSCPKIAFRSDSVESLVVEFRYDDIRGNQDEILDLPYTIAMDKGYKVVVCIDDFQFISLFSDPEALLESFKKRWVKHEGVAYCVSSSACSMVEQFIKSTQIFQMFGNILHLNPIDRTDIVNSLRDRFADSGKYLDNEIAELILDKVGSHTFYTQQLAHLSWMGTAVVCSGEVVLQAYEDMIDQKKLVFEVLTSSLTPQQICYLHAVLAGETVISTSEVLHRHNITSATSASRSKSALLERGIIYNMNGRICFTDPIYADWLKSRYFN